MRLIAIIVFLTLLITSCFAERDSVTTGPYKVTFDLGVPKDDYRINVSSGEPDDDDAHIIIYTENLEIKYDWYDDYNNYQYNIQRDGIIRISLDPCRDEPNYMHMQDQLVKLWELGASNTPTHHNSDVVGEKIGGYDGVFSSWTTEQPWGWPDRYNYMAAYYPSSTLFVRMQSEYPSTWEEGFMNLIKTIHVEMINETL
jgi:hypothetical protein